MWFMAVLVRGAHVHGVLDDERLGDMLYCLVESDDAEGAYEQALAIGQEASDTYEDEEGITVSIAFLGLAALTEIAADTIGNGTEVYSQLIPKRPLEMVVAKEKLTVFEADEDHDREDDAEDPA